MISDAYVTVTCDACPPANAVEEEVQLTATAGGGYDDRHVASALRGLGWTINHGLTGSLVCPNDHQ